MLITPGALVSAPDGWYHLGSLELAVDRSPVPASYKVYRTNRGDQHAGNQRRKDDAPPEVFSRILVCSEPADRTITPHYFWGARDRDTGNFAPVLCVMTTPGTPENVVP